MFLLTLICLKARGLKQSLTFEHLLLSSRHYLRFSIFSFFSCYMLTLDILLCTVCSPSFISALTLPQSVLISHCIAVHHQYRADYQLQSVHRPECPSLKLIPQKTANKHQIIFRSAERFICCSRDSLRFTPTLCSALQTADYNTDTILIQILLFAQSVLSKTRFYCRA